jgi:16S rRNA (guanine966-N2)-methyltransferase
MSAAPRRPRSTDTRPAWLRIIGGQLRGQRIRYSGDPQVRPMKDRVREALFNLLGDAVQGKHAIDLFAGTGALGLEAVSRGAARATLIERHGPTAALLRENVERLKLGDRVDVERGDAFSSPAHRPDAERPTPWLVFFSPPYAFYEQRASEVAQLLDRLVRQAPPGSTVVVETVESYDLASLPLSDLWQVRHYPPAVLAILHETPGPTEARPEDAAD